MLYVLIRIAYNEYIQHTTFNIKKKITLIHPKCAAMGFCSKNLKKKFEAAVINELSVFEPLKSYCASFFMAQHHSAYPSVNGKSVSTIMCLQG